MPSTASSKVKIIKGREMLSLIRGAFAFQDRVALYLDDTPTDCVIIAFNDSDLRDTNIDRDIEVTLPKTLFHSIAQEGQKVILEVISDASKLRMNCELSIIRSSSLIIKLPKEGQLHQARDTSRFSIDEQPWSDAIVFSENAAVPCVFKVSNFSANGIGILLVSSIPLEDIGIELNIEGNSITLNYSFKGPYKIQRLKLLKEAENFYEYSIGLDNSTQKSETFPTTRAGRHQVDSALQLNVSATNTKLTAKLTDVSASGFKAKIPSQSLSGIAKDLIATELSSGVSFKITRVFKNEEVGFQLISNTPNDQIRWLNLMMPFLSKGRVDVNVADSRTLVNLFFEAGASIVDGLEYKRFRLTQKDALSLLTAQSDVLIRWVNLSETGTVLGHHSTYRVGLNSWYTGDVVGGQTEDNRADRNFFNDNFRILREAMECFNTQQKILGSWKPNHPYWQGWRTFLIENKLTYCMQMCDSVARHQIQNFLDLTPEHRNKTNFIALEGKELFEEIETLSTDLKWFLGALDVFNTGDSSEGTKEIYLKNRHHGFKRGMKRLICDGKEYLVLLSQLPAGIAINPNFDSAFIFPKNDQQLTNSERNRLYATVVLNASRQGYRLTSVRFFSQRIEYSGTPTEFFVIDSRGLEIFK